MKRIYALLFVAGCVQAQIIPNNGFEEKLDDGMSLQSWGSYFPNAEYFNPATGQNVTDEIWFDNGISFSFGVPDCWTGSSAMYLSNAFNSTKNEVIPGFVRLFDNTESEIANGTNYGKSIPPGTLVQIFGFDYKYSPMANDVARGWIEVYDDNGQKIGGASIDLVNPVFDFQYVYTPIQFTAPGTPAFVQIGFDMRSGDSEVNWGSTLIVDNVIINWTMLGIRERSGKTFTVYPTLADSQINLQATDQTAGNYAVSIIDINGRTVRETKMDLDGSAVGIDVDGLQSGVYLLRAQSAQNQSVTRFVKK